MKNLANKDLPQNLKEVLIEKLTGFGLMICEAMVHIDACLHLEHANFPKLSQIEVSVLHISHFKLSIIEAAKLLSHKLDSNDRIVKNDNDKYSIYSILAFLDGFNPKYKSESLIIQLNDLRKELTGWEQFNGHVINLRNEAYAHLGTKKRRSELAYVETNYLNNLIVLLKEFHLIINIEYNLGFIDLMDLDLEKISKIYKKGFS